MILLTFFIVFYFVLLIHTCTDALYCKLKPQSLDEKNFFIMVFYDKEKVVYNELDYIVLSILIEPKGMRNDEI